MGRLRLQAANLPEVSQHEAAELLRGLPIGRGANMEKFTPLQSDGFQATLLY